jgi:prepilin-type N-terminal cleavage/methylation domain-containing protein
MNSNQRRSAFTLIEVLIVVVIMAVLAATIVPQFSSSTTDSKESSLKFNMLTLRSQIELYKMHHGSYPEVRSNALPQLTTATNAAGETSSTGFPDADHPFGPYLDGNLPANPFDGSNNVDEVSLGGAKPAAETGNRGWQYDPATGAVWPNNAEYYQAETTTGG